MSEPVAGQVPAEAVEAAAKARYDNYAAAEYDTWEELCKRDPEAPEVWRDEAALVLAAAAPLIAAAQQERARQVVADLCDEASAEVARLTAELAAIRSGGER